MREKEGEQQLKERVRERERERGHALLSLGKLPLQLAEHVLVLVCPRHFRACDSGRSIGVERLLGHQLNVLVLRPGEHCVVWG